MKKALILAICAAGAMTACGGRDDPPPVTEAVPGSASVSVAGFISYLRLLVASSADTLEPVDVSAVTPQTTETGDPEIVD